jgi:hypothetical protein
MAGLSNAMEEAWLRLVEACCPFEDAQSAEYQECLAEYIAAKRDNERALHWERLCSEEPWAIECRIYDC